MLRTIVEGEPGVFPEPVARIMRGIGGVFRRKPKPTGPRAEDASDAAPPDAPRDGHRGGPEGDPGQSGDST